VHLPVGLQVVVTPCDGVCRAVFRRDPNEWVHFVIAFEIEAVVAASGVAKDFCLRTTFIVVSAVSQ
jgi:hypothetical protein